MSRVFTEVAANADFSTGVTCPTPGEAGTQWWNEYEALFQELADRSQALAQLTGVASNQVVAPVRLLASAVGSRWNQQVGATAVYYLQTSVTDGGAIWFSLDPLPVGAKLISATVRLAGGAPFISPYTHAGLPATMPTLTAYRQTDGTATSLGSQTDTSGNVTIYDAMHSVTVTLNHTIVSGAHYHLKITGEASTNSNASVLSLASLSLLLSAV